MTAIGRTSGLPRSSAEPSATLAEHAFRVRAAWALWYFVFQASLGLTWDIRWHGAVGRDSFWTPPHLLIYSGVLFAGLVCLFVVLVDTVRYRRLRAAVTDSTTWPVLGYFRAPLGFIVAGCGTAVLLAAAPLDNWWHTLYGVDVLLWTPFHMMGLFGATIATVGSIYAFAALASADRRRRPQAPGLVGFRTLEWAALLALSSLLTLIVTAAQPATTISPTIELGPFRVLTYPVLLGALLPGLFVAAVRMTSKPGSATAVLLLFAARQLLAAAVVPWGIRMTVALGGYAYRTSEPTFSLVLVVSALIFLPTSLAIDILARGSMSMRVWFQRVNPKMLWGAAVGGAVPVLLLGPILVARAGTARAQLPPEFIIPVVAVVPGALLAIGPTLVLSFVGVAVGMGWGAILYHNDR